MKNIIYDHKVIERKDFRMPALNEVLVISNMDKVTNPEILSQFVRAQNLLENGSENKAVFQIAEAVRNAVRETSS